MVLPSVRRTKVQNARDQMPRSCTQSPADVDRRSKTLGGTPPSLRRHQTTHPNLVQSPPLSLRRNRIPACHRIDQCWMAPLPLLDPLRVLTARPSQKPLAKTNRRINCGHTPGGQTLPSVHLPPQVLAQAPQDSMDRTPRVVLAQLLPRNAQRRLPTAHAPGVRHLCRTT